MKICPISSPYIRLFLFLCLLLICPHVTSSWLINDRGLSAPGHFRPLYCWWRSFVESSWSAAQQNKVAPSHFVPSSLLSYIFYEWQELKKWIHGKSTLSNYWDISKVKRSKNSLSAAPLSLPSGCLKCGLLPCFDMGSEYGGGPSGNQSWLLGLQGQAFRERQMCHWRQPTMTYRHARQPGRVWQTTTRSLHENTHSHLFLCSYNNLVERSFIFSLGTLWAKLFLFFPLFSFADFNLHPLKWSMGCFHVKKRVKCVKGSENLFSLWAMGSHMNIKPSKVLH